MKPCHIAWGLVLLLLLGLCINPIQDTDVFMYLAIVREYLITGIWPKTDAFSFSLPQSPLDTLHEWGSYFIFYGFYQIFHSSGLLLLKTVLVLGTFLVPLYQFLRSKNESVWVVLAVVLAAYVSSTRFAERSSLFGDFLGNLVLYFVLNRNSSENRYPLPIALPLIFVVWVNLHPSFPLGLGLIALGLVADCKNWKRQGFKNQFTVFILCIAACFVHPQGWHGFIYPFHFFFHEATFFKKVNFEWVPIWEPQLQAYWELKGFYLEAILVLVFFGGILGRGFLQKRGTGRRSRDLKWIQEFQTQISKVSFEVLAFGILVYLGLSSVRFVIFSSVGLVQILIRLSDQIKIIQSPSSQDREKNESQLWMEWGLISSCIISLLLSLNQLVEGTYLSGFDRRHLGVGLDTRYFPNESLRFLDEQKIQGPVFNTYWLGCYLAWYWERQRKVFAHGFMTNTEFIENDYLMLSKSLSDFDRITQKYGFEAFLIGKELSLRGLFPILNSHPKWKLAFEDHASYVFTKRMAGQR